MNAAGTYEDHLAKDLGVVKTGTHKKEVEIVELPPLNRAERRAQDRRRRLSVKREKRLEALKASRKALS